MLITNYCKNSLKRIVYKLLTKKCRAPPYEYKILDKFNPTESSNYKYFGKCVATKISVINRKTGKLQEIVREVETSKGKLIFRATISGFVLRLQKYNKDYIVTKAEEEELKKWTHHWINKPGLKNQAEILKINLKSVNTSMFAHAHAKKAPMANLAGAFYTASYVFIFDDGLECLPIKNESLRQYIEDAYEYRELIIEGLKSVNSNSLSEPFGQLESQELLIKLKKIDKSLGTKFAPVHPYLLEVLKFYLNDEYAKDLIDAFLIYLSGTKRNLNSCKTSQQFLEERVDDSGALLLLEVSLHAERIIVPEKIRQDHLFQEFKQCLVIYIVIINDIVSLSKESERNYLLCKCSFFVEEGNHENPLESAIKEAFDELNNLRLEILEIKRKLKEKYDQEIIVPILEFGERFFEGDLLWYEHRNTKRYDHDIKYESLNSQIKYEHFFIKYIDKRPPSGPLEVSLLNNR